MTSLNNTSLSLLLALGLLGAACGDDNNATPRNGDDAGNNTNGTQSDAGGKGGDAGSGKQCTGSTYAEFTSAQITANIKNADGACANEDDIAGVCTQDPSAKAKTLGVACFSSFGGGTGTTDEKQKKIAECTLNGSEQTGKKTDGLVDLLPSISSDCLSCYADSVGCSALNCGGVCLADPSGQPCADCRIKNKCTPNFYTCSGLPTADELEAAQ